MSHPIFLVHGIYPFDKALPFAFDEDNGPSDDRHYFRNIRSTLMAEGYTVFHVCVDWGGPLEKRADDLHKAIRRSTDDFTKYGKVHIVGHSMGGLDARAMLCRHREMVDRVVSVATVGSPHHGSPFADWLVRRGDFGVALAKTMGLDLTGLRDLTREARRAFNTKNEAWEMKNKVAYRAWAGYQDYGRIFAPLKLSHPIIYEAEGKNDGLSSVASARWRTSVHAGTVDADHLNQIGWWDPDEWPDGDRRDAMEKRIKRLYVDIARAAVADE